MKDVALWVNDAVLLGTAILVARYVAATHKLVIASREQVRISQQQVESLSLPAVVVQESGDQINLVNIGNGPAMSLEWHFKDTGSALMFFDDDDPIDDPLPYLLAGKTQDLSFRRGALVTRELHCTYRSLSGRRYVSVSRFSKKGMVETEFHARAVVCQRTQAL